MYFSVFQLFYVFLPPAKTVKDIPYMYAITVTYFVGRAMAQAVSRRPLTAEARVRSRPIPVAARYKVWVYGRSLTGIVGSNPAGGMDVCVVFVV